MKKINRIITEPWRIIASERLRKVTRYLPDIWFLKCKYRSTLNKKLNLKNPTSFCEKLQWLKINDHDLRYTTLVDKFGVKQHVADIIGETYIIKTYGVWKTFDEISFDELPNQFVLKCTHDSASIVICKNKSSFNKIKAREKLNACLEKNHYYAGREWQYKNVEPQIIAEEYLEDSTFNELRDYKFFTFHGVPKIMHLVTNRQKQDEETYGDFFDMDFNHLDLTMGHANSPVLPEKPANFEMMKQFAEILSKDTIHLRVDFYEVNGKLFFGELTFYENSGFIDIKPSEWNDTLGSWLDLTKLNT